MAFRVQILRHDPAAAAVFVGLIGEVTFETINNRLRLHDNVTPGGIIVPNADQITVLIAALGTTLTVQIDALTAGKMNRSVITDANEVVIGTAANTEAVLAMAASTILARLGSGDIVAATPLEIKTLLDVTPFLVSIGTLGTAADRLIKTSGVATAEEIVITTAGESLLSAANAAAQRTLLDTPNTATINSAIAAGLVVLIPVGTVMCFFQASAPAGWTQVVSQNDKVFRVVSGTGGGTGGSWTISGVSVDGHAISIAEMPAHTHPETASQTVMNPGENPALAARSSAGTTGSTGGGGTHTHGLTADGNWRPAYINVIIASKDG